MTDAYRPEDLDAYWPEDLTDQALTPEDLIASATDPTEEDALPATRRAHVDAPARNPSPLHQARVRSGLSLRDVAKRAETTASYVGALERGTRQPSVAMAASLADAAAMSDDERRGWLATALPNVGRSHPTNPRRPAGVEPPATIDPGPLLRRLTYLAEQGAVLPDTGTGRQLMQRLRRLVEVLELEASVAERLRRTRA